MSNNMPRPFTIHIPDEALDDLRNRLRGARWTEDFGNDDWAWGVERGWLEEMVCYWTEDFDWRAQEKLINAFPHYQVTIDDVPIHYIHVRGKGSSPRPLILSHGWPWTFWDYKDVIGPLADPAAHGGDPADAFDVIVPSLPGFDFSSPLRRIGIDQAAVADLWHKLMHEVLGYNEYFAAGGDMGARVTSYLGLNHGDHVRGIFLTMPVAPNVNPFQLSPAEFAPDEQWMAKRVTEAMPVITSHFAVHRADPQTLAYALQDSPLGLAAWIWERRRAWSDCNGDLIALHGRDFLCTTASLYWLTGTIGTSMRAYRESSLSGPMPEDVYISVPTGYGIAPRDVVMLPRRIAAQRTNLQRWSILPRGGHFLPAEQPQLAVDEYRTFFRTLQIR